MDSIVRALSDLDRNRSLHLGGVGKPGKERSTSRILSSPAVPPRPVRIAQRVAVKIKRLDWERAWLNRLIEARVAELGADQAAGPPRFLVRVDEFPYSTGFYDQDSGGLEASRRFHATMAAAKLPHLMAILPQPADDPLNPDATVTRQLSDAELELIEVMRGDDVTFAQHGTTHRTLDAHPRRRSELLGLNETEAGEVLDQGRAVLQGIGIETRVFVPPFNRFASSQWDLLADRFDIICGGPESIALMGYQGGPLWRGDAVYLPCYAPLYGSAREVLPIVEHLIERAPGTWIPIVLHTGWEAEDDFASLARLAERVSPFACRWEDFLADLDQSRAAARGS